MIGLEELWARIEAYEGSVFRLIRAGEFTYSIVGSGLKPSRTNRILPKSQFEKALEFVPLENTAPIQKLQGPSYIFAILMDPRIRGNDW